MIVSKEPSSAIVSSEHIIPNKNILYIRGYQSTTEAICSSRLAYFKYIVSSCEAIVLDDTCMTFMKSILKWIRVLMKDKHVIVLCSNQGLIHTNITKLLGYTNIFHQQNSFLPVFSHVNTYTILRIETPKLYDTFGIASYNIFHPGIIVTFGRPKSYEYETLIYDCTHTKQMWF